MVWNGLEKEVAEELEEIGLDTGIQFSDSVLQERTDRPTLVRNGAISVSRPVNEFSSNEKDMVKWEAVSDILAYEAGLSSPGTVSETDWDEIHVLYDELERGDLTELLPGTDEAQKRINACMLMRDKAEEIRSYSDKAENLLQTVESINSEALGTLFTREGPMFEDENVPENYFHLIDLLKDYRQRKECPRELLPPN